jgi:hypothetical protein
VINLKKEERDKRRLNVLTKRFNLKNPKEAISITFTREEWYHIWEEARQKLGFTNQDSLVIEKLKEYIEEKDEPKG